MSSFQKSEKESSRTVRVFAASSFFHDVGSDMVFSVWPLFLRNVLGANMAVIGLIDGLGDAVVSLSQALSGYLSDKTQKRKVFVWLGYLLGGISRIGYALAPSWQAIIPFRILDRSGKMRGSPRDAIIVEASDHTNRGKQFGIIRMMDNLGAVVGVLIAFVLLKHVPFRTLFFLAAIPSFIAVALVYIYIKDSAKTQRIFKGIQFNAFSKNLWVYTISSSIFTLGSFSYSFLLIAASGKGFSDAAVPILYLLFTAVAAAFSLPFGKLADRVGRKSVMLLSFLFWIIVSILFIAQGNTWGVIMAFIFYGLHMAAIEPVQKTIVAELAPKDLLASTLGGFQMIIGLMSLPASVLAGLLWDHFGMGTAFFFSGSLTIVAGMLLFFVKETR